MDPHSVMDGSLAISNQPFFQVKVWFIQLKQAFEFVDVSGTRYLLLRGSGYLGYVDSNQGYNPYKWVICPQILGL